MRKLTIAALLIFAAGSLACAGSWEPVWPGGAAQIGGYADVLWYNLDEAPSSFALNNMALTLDAELAEDVLVSAEVEWAGPRAPFPFMPEPVDGEEGAVRENANLTYANVSYRMMDSMTMVAGKFLVPFNVYNTRLYRPDVAKLAVPPYMNAATAGMRSPLSAKWAETGIKLWGQIDTAAPVGLDYAVYYVNGLGMEVDDGSDRGIGGRIGVVSPLGFELGFSGYRAEIDPVTSTNMEMLGADLCYKYDTIELRGEFIRLDRNDLTDDGFYLQAAYGFLDRYEVVARYDSAVANRTTLGGNYKLTDDLTFRVAYEWSNELADGITTQLAVKF